MSMERPPIHVERMRLRWGELDALRHLNNVSYFRYFEQARLSWFESLGFDYVNDAEGALLGSIDCRFIRPVLYPAELAIELRPGRVGSASFVLEHRMRLDAQDSPVFAEGAATMVWVNLAEGRSRPLPSRMRGVLGG